MKYSVSIWCSGEGWESSEGARTLRDARELARSMRADYGDTRDRCHVMRDDSVVIASWRHTGRRWQAVTL